MRPVGEKANSLETFSETVKGKMIRSIFITLLQKLCSSMEARDPVRKFHEVETPLRFLSQQLPEIRVGITV